MVFSVPPLLAAKAVEAVIAIARTSVKISTFLMNQPPFLSYDSSAERICIRQIQR
jgi:hypothetical protein